MAHTPSFSKRINEKLLLWKRITYDSFSIADSNEKTIVHPLQETLDEHASRYLVYSDFYERT